MNSQEIAIANWRLNFQQMADRFVAACGEADLQRARADALQKELDALKAPKKKHAKPNPPNLAAVG